MKYFTPRLSPSIENDVNSPGSFPYNENLTGHINGVHSHDGPRQNINNSNDFMYKTITSSLNNNDTPIVF